MISNRFSENLMEEDGLRQTGQGKFCVWKTGERKDPVGASGDEEVTSRGEGVSEQ